jgi:hypothetical protein
MPPAGRFSLLIQEALQMTLPMMVKIKQHFDTDSIGDISAAIRSEITRLNPEQVIKPGQRVAITAGSRGICKIAEIIGSLVNELKRIDAKPFIVPAMGSHGGATAEGQKEVPAHCGINEETQILCSSRPRDVFSVKNQKAP